MSAIYDNWLFDIPKIFDLCAIYGSTNASKVRTMIFNVFKIQSEYYNDFKDFLDEILIKQIPDALKILNMHRKRDNLDMSTIESDSLEKEQVLIKVYDIL